MKPSPQVIERKLGRERAAGLCWGDEIEVDPRQSARERMDTLVHETLHHLWPDMPETKVERAARTIARVLWRDRYRRIHP